MNIYLREAEEMILPASIEATVSTGGGTSVPSLGLRGFGLLVWGRSGASGRSPHGGDGAPGRD